MEHHLRDDQLFDVRDACAAAMPKWLGSLAKLRQLWLQSNQLVGRIPEALGALQELTHLNLWDNKLT
ncbi:unnamed protein product, partial [Ectocarpus sp. 8 AP-2014]